MNLRRTRAIARKELLHVVRDARSLVLALALPVLMLVMFGSALSLDVDHIRTVIHDADGSVMSRDLAERFRASRFFDVQGGAVSRRDIEERVASGRTMIGVSVPPNFGRNIKNGQAVEVQLLVDGSDSNTASLALAYAEAVVRNFSTDVQQEWQKRMGGFTAQGSVAAPLDVRLRVLYNSQMESKNYIVPGLIAVIVMIIASFLTSMTIAREWEMGTIEQLLSTPVRPAEIVAGKMAAYFCVGLAATLLCILTALTLFAVPLRGSTAVLAVSVCVFLCAALFWGIFLSAMAKNQMLAFQMSMTSSFLPAFLLSGFVFGIESMPRIMQLVTLAIPARHFVTIVKGVFLKGTGLQVLWWDMGFLLLFALVMFWAATRQLSGKIA